VNGLGSKVNGWAAGDGIELQGQVRELDEGATGDLDVQGGGLKWRGASVLGYGGDSSHFKAVWQWRYDTILDGNVVSVLHA
jgi:hypothetical protein